VDAEHSGDSIPPIPNANDCPEPHSEPPEHQTVWDSFKNLWLPRIIGFLVHFAGYSFLILTKANIDEVIGQCAASNTARQSTNTPKTVGVISVTWNKFGVSAQPVRVRKLK